VKDNTNDQANRWYVACKIKLRKSNHFSENFSEKSNENRIELGIREKTHALIWPQIIGKIIQGTISAQLVVKFVYFTKKTCKSFLKYRGHYVADRFPRHQEARSWSSEQVGLVGQAPFPSAPGSPTLTLMAQLSKYPIIKSSFKP
jgi:hypothetical protein